MYCGVGMWVGALCARDARGPVRLDPVVYGTRFSVRGSRLEEQEAGEVPGRGCSGLLQKKEKPRCARGWRRDFDRGKFGFPPMRR